MLYQVMAASGLFFWFLVMAAVLVVAIPLGNEMPAGAVFLFCVAIAALILFTDLASRMSWWTLLLVPLYIAIGVAYALKKWRDFVLEKKREAIDGHVKYMATPDGPNVVPKAERKPLAEYIANKRPTASANADKITGWMALWPWSMSWVVVRLPWRLIVLIYNQISTVFERWSAKLWAE